MKRNKNGSKFSDDVTELEDLKYTTEFAEAAFSSAL
jgi:hypothetical protein